ncbi:MAG: hypothetical protein ABW145_09250, partial [Candidatus Thiodiazotropha sp.]
AITSSHRRVRLAAPKPSSGATVSLIMLVNGAASRTLRAIGLTANLRKSPLTIASGMSGLCLWETSCGVLNA